MRRPPSRGALAGAGALAVLIAACVAIVAGGGGGDPAGDPRGQGEPEDAAMSAAALRLQVISPRPLSKRAVEAAIEELYVPMRDDDSAFVACSGREAKPAHSVRRCEVRYPGGAERRVVVLTNARGNEVLSRP